MKKGVSFVSSFVNIDKYLNKFFPIVLSSEMFNLSESFLHSPKHLEMVEIM